ncbi:MAG: hypothetical protein R3E98_11285 [Gemmatimonadota bacterium]
MLLALTLLGGGRLAAQNSCDVPNFNLWRIFASGTPNETHIFTGVTVVCADGLVIRADSAVVVPSQSVSRLFRDVRFDEGGRLLTADRADYYSRDDRLQAWGSVVLVDSAQGSRVEGDELLYLRSGDTRPRQRITVTGPEVRATLRPQPRPRRPEVSDSVAAPVDSLPSDTAGVSDSPPVAAPVPRSFPFHWLWQWILQRLVQEGVVTPGGTPDRAALGPEPADTAARPDSLVGPDTTRRPAPPAVDAALAPAGPPQAPYHVTAHRRIVLDGESAFEAEGQVEVEREGLHAFGERLRYDEDWEQLHLLGAARSEGERYRLTADAIALYLRDQEVDQVVARDRARLATDDLEVDAPRIRLFVADSTVTRLAAGLLGPTDTVPVVGSQGPEGAVLWSSLEPAPGDSARAVARAEDFHLSADSLDVLTPEEQLERVTAIGRARGDSFSRDSLNAAETPELVRNDWLEGDTIVALFAPDSTAPATADSAGTDPAGYVLERLVAQGGARSLYRLEPSDTTRAATDRRLAVHYVVGDTIAITMVDGEVDRMEVHGQTQGLHLEPMALPADTAAADSLRGDTARVTPDTVRVGEAPAPRTPGPPVPAELPRVARPEDRRARMER